LQIVSFLFVAWVGHEVVAQQNEGYFFILFGLLMLAGMVFFIEEAYLPMILLATLLLSNSYSYSVSAKSFYVRFAVMALIVLRTGLGSFYRRSQGEIISHGWYQGVSFWGICLLAALGVLVSPFSIAPVLSFQRALSLLLLLFVCFVSLPSAAHSSKEVENYLVHMWKVLGAVLILGFLALFMGLPGLYTVSRLRLFLGNPNQLGHWAALFFPIWIWMAMNEKIRWQMILCGVAMAAALVLSGSRGALLAAGIAMTIQATLCYRRKLGALICSGAILIGVHVILDNGLPDNSFQEFWVRGDTLLTGSGRTDVWEVAKDLMKNRPLIGYGFGSTEYLFQQGYFSEVPDTFQGGHVHNGYLESALDMGFVGIFCIFLFVGAWLSLALRHLLRPRIKTKSYELTCAIAGVVIAGLVSNVFESWITSVGSLFAFPFWFSVALFLLMIHRFNDWKPGFRYAQPFSSQSG